MPRNPVPRCVRRHACSCRGEALTQDAPVRYSVLRDKPTVSTPNCPRCKRPMPRIGGHYQALLDPSWDTDIVRERVRRMFTALIAWP